MSKLLVAIGFAYLDVFAVGSVCGNQDEIVLDVKLRKSEVRVTDLLERRDEGIVIAHVAHCDLDIGNWTGGELRHRRRSDVLDAHGNRTERRLQSCGYGSSPLRPRGVVRNNPMIAATAHHVCQPSDPPLRKPVEDDTDGRIALESSAREGVVMTVADEAQAERERLLQTLTTVGPEAPTAVGVWTAAGIASHLAAQDRLGGWPAFAARSLVRATGFRLSAAYSDRPRVALLVHGRQKPWEKSLDRLRQPIPSAVLRGRVGPVTLWEHFVHHEDVRRPNNAPREEWPDLDEALNWILAYNRRQMGDQVSLQRTAGETTLRIGDRIALSGATPEVVLWLSGRRYANVHLDGSTSEIDDLAHRLKV